MGEQKASSYVDNIREKTRHFSSTFLTMDSLVTEVAERVLGFPKWAIQIAIAAVVVATLATTVPIIWSILAQNVDISSRVDALEKQVAALQQSHASRSNLQVDHTLQ